MKVTVARRVSGGVRELSARATPFNGFIKIVGRPAPSRAPAGTRFERERGRERKSRVCTVYALRCVGSDAYIYIYVHTYVCICLGLTSWGG